MGGSIRAVPGTTRLWQALGGCLGGRCPHTPLLLFATSLQHRPCAREPSGRHPHSIFCHLGIQHPFNLFQIPHYCVSSRLQALAYSNSCIASQILPIRQTKTPRKVRKVELHTSRGDLLEVKLRSSSTNTEFMKAPAQKGHGKVWASHPASSSSPFRAVLSPKAHPRSRPLLSQVTQQKANYSQPQAETSPVPAPLYLHCSNPEPAAGTAQQQLPGRFHPLQWLIENRNFRHLQFWKINKQLVRLTTHAWVTAPLLFFFFPSFFCNITVMLTRTDIQAPLWMMLSLSVQFRGRGQEVNGQLVYKSRSRRNNALGQN